MNYYLGSTLLLTILLAIGLFFFLKASSKDRTTITDISSSIQFLDKEVRKLWGHRKGYLDSIKKQESKAIKNEKSIQNLKAISTGLEDQINVVNQKIELAEDLQLKLTLLSNELNKQKKVLETNEASIEAVDIYRKQNNQKVADVLNRINALDRDLQELEKELNDLKNLEQDEQLP